MAGKYIKKKSTMIKRKGSSLNLLGRPINRFDYGGYPNMDNSMFPNMNHYYSNTNNPNLRVQKSETPVLQKVNGADKLFNQPVTSSKSSNPISSVSGGGSKSGKSGGAGYDQMADTLGQVNTGLAALNAATDKSGGTKQGQLALSQVSGGDGMNHMIGEAIFGTSQILGLFDNAFTSKRKPLEETVGLYGNGGDLSRNVNLFAGGGGAAAGGGGFNFGSMMGMMGNMGGGQGGGMMGGQGGGGKANDIQNAINTGMALAANSVFESQNPSTGDLKTRLYQAGARQFNSITNQDLANEVGQRNMNYDHVGMRDIRNKSLFSEFNDSLGASAKGYEAGSAFGPWGAGIGGVVGGASSLIGSIIGKHKAYTERNKINKAADVATARQGINLLQAADRIDKNNNFNIAANYGIQSAYGGDLNTLGNGGGIHINPANKGKLTATSKRTGKSFSELAHSSDPLTRKRAIFALNARKWNHKAYGGLIDENNNNQLDASMLLSNPALQPYLYSKEELLNGVNSSNTPQEENNNYQNQLLNINPTREIQPAVMPITTQIPYAPVKSQLTTILNPKEYVTRTPLPVYNNSKYSASKQIRNMIAKWEGSSMKTNVPIDTKFRELMNIIPRDSINRLSPYQLDALGSYYYNVKPQSFTRTVGGALQKLGRAQDINEYNNILAEIAKGINIGMGNRKLPGLKTRRLAEQNIFLNGYNHFAEGGPIKHNKTTLKESIIPLFPQLFSKKDVDNLKKLHPEYFYLPQKDKLTNDQQILSIFKGNRNPSGALKAYIPDEKNIDVTDQSYIPDNRYALGGTLKENSQFSNGVTEYNTGGTHEENPNGGVPIGTDSNGTPNLVEQGEVRYKDYIYSNRLAPSREILESVGLSPLYAKYSYAKLAELLSKESNERPNDPISQNGLNDIMLRLKNAQDLTKNEMQAAQQQQMAQNDNQYEDLEDYDDNNQYANPQENTQEEVENNNGETQQYAEGGDLFNKYNGVNLFVGGGDGDITPFDINQLLTDIPSYLNDNESEFSHNYLVDKYKNPNGASEYIPLNYKKFDINKNRKFYNSFVTKAALNKRAQAYKTAFNTALNLYRNGDITRGVYYQLCSRLQNKFKNFYLNNAGKHLNKVADPHSNTTMLYNRTEGLDLTGQEIKEINQEIKFAREHPESQLGYQSRNGIVYNKNGYAVTDPDKGYFMTDPNKTRIKNDADNAFSIYVTPSEKAAFKKHPDPSDEGVKKGENPPVNEDPPVNKPKHTGSSGRRGRYVTSSVNYNSPEINLQEQALNENLNTSAIDELGKILAQNKEGYKVDSKESEDKLFDTRQKQVDKEYLDDLVRNSMRKGERKNMLRYAPIIGSAIGVLSDMAGLTNKPNYDNENWLISQANSQPNVNYKPSGNYLGYNPLDRDYALNKFNAAYNASREQLANTANGNRANLQAQLANLNNNYFGSLGDNEMKVELQNISNRNEVDKYNNSLDQANAEMAMKAQMANAEQDRFRLQAFENAAQMKNAKDASASQAKSANLTNLFNNLGDLGREQYQSDQLQWMKNNGLFGNTPVSSVYDDYKAGRISLGDYVNQLRGRDVHDDEIKYALSHNGDLSGFRSRIKKEEEETNDQNLLNQRALSFYNKFNTFAKTDQGKSFLTEHPDLSLTDTTSSDEDTNVEAYGGKIKSKRKRYTK